MPIHDIGIMFVCLFQSEDVNYFTYRDVNRTTVALVLARSLDDLVDTESPQNVLKFKLMCEYHDGEDTVRLSTNKKIFPRNVVINLLK